MTGAALNTGTAGDLSCIYRRIRGVLGITVRVVMTDRTVVLMLGNYTFPAIETGGRTVKVFMTGITG